MEVKVTVQGSGRWSVSGQYVNRPVPRGGGGGRWGGGGGGSHTARPHRLQAIDDIHVLVWGVPGGSTWGIVRPGPAQWCTLTTTTD